MKLTHLMFLTMSVLVLAGCKNNNKHTQQFDQLQKSLVSADSSFMSNDNMETMVYYFHATRRCATCQAVENATKEALAEYFGEEITFTSINREEDKDNPLIEKHNINGQTLLVIKGEKVVNLTNDAFMNARTKPEKLKEKIKATIETL